MLESWSWSTFDEVIEFVLKKIDPKAILDIGAGEGKYGRMTRAAGLDKAQVTAVEFNPGRREELLALGYDSVRSIGALDLLEEPATTYELVVLGDVIEHFRWSDGMDLLQYLNYRSEYILVITPESMAMNVPNFHDGHNSLWRPDAMRWHDLWAHCRCGVMHFYLLRGYLGNGRTPLREIVEAVNAQQFILKLSSSKLKDQTCVLQLHDTTIADPYKEPGMVGVYRPK